MQSVQSFDPETFEWVCGGIIREIAEDAHESPIGSPIIMARNYDGGIEAKIATVSGAFAVQCKRYDSKSFDNECASAQKSFATFLTKPTHSVVTTYFWCSANSRTTTKEDKAKDAIAKMRSAAAAAGRRVRIEIRFAGDLDRIIRERRPEYYAIVAGHEPLEQKDLDRYTERQAAAILERFDDEDVPLLQFPAQPTEQFLDLTIRAGRTQMLDIPGFADLIGEFEHYRRGGLSVGDDDASVLADALTKELQNVSAPQQWPLEHAPQQLDDLADCASRCFDQAYELLMRHRGNSASRGDSIDDYRRNGELKHLARFAMRVGSVRRRLGPVQAAANAALDRRLLVTGQWGTGKSYQLATTARRIASDGAPVLLLRGRDLVLRDQQILEQPWRDHLPARPADPTQFLALLDAIGHHAKQPVVIAIDGLNESALRNEGEALDNLCHQIQRFPNLRLIVTDRRDRALTGGFALPAFRHLPPRSVVISRALESALGAPPGTAWHVALANPLLASIAVRVLRSAHSIPASGLSRAALLEAWIDLLIDETTIRLDVPTATIRRLIDAIAFAGGSERVPELASQTKLSSDRVDAIVEHLADEGLLERGTDDEDTVRFRWEAAFDIYSIRRAYENGGIDALLHRSKTSERASVLDVLAQIVPTAKGNLELPDLELSAVSADEKDQAFALSLSERAVVSVRATEHAARVLRTGGDAAAEVVWAVLSAPGRQQLGFEWLNAQLRVAGVDERAAFWPTALEQLCERSEHDQDAMEDLLGWYAASHWASLSPDAAAHAIELLAWFGCASRHTGLPAFATRSVVAIAEQHPAALTAALSRISDVDDDHPLDVLFTSAAGITARRVSPDAVEVAEATCRRALAGPHTPRSLRALGSIYRALSIREPLSEFLHDAVRRHALPRAPLRPVGIDFISEDDRAMFADSRTGRKARRFEAAIWRTFHADERHRTRFADDDTDARYQHDSSLLRGRWFALQYADHAVGARMWTGMRPVKAGHDRNTTVSRVADPDEVWDHPDDPTLPLDLSAANTDHVRADDWWAIDHHGESGAELVATDPSGSEWIVIEGRFRHLDPPETHVFERPRYRFGRTSWNLGRADDGGAQPGRSRHMVVRVDDAVVTGDGRRSSRRATTLFSDIFASTPSDGALVAVLDDAAVAVPTAHLLGLVDATWSGLGIDCHDSDGRLVITDPARGGDGPHAVLVLREALLDGLRRTGSAITVQLTLSDINAHHMLSGRKANDTLVIDGVDH